MDKTDSNQVSLEEIYQFVFNLRKYPPKVGIFGNSGVGKSSLCNALFGQDIAPINDVEACTREPQEIFVGNKDKTSGIILVDMPGIGEDPKRQKEYTELYKSMAPELDLVLWAIKADDRNYASGLDTYSVIVEGEKAPPIIFVITQVDKMNPIKEWDDNDNKPGETQMSNIAVKENDVSRRFNVSTKNIISVSAENMYNLKELITLIVEVSPDEKKYSFTREAKEENVTEEAREKAEEGILAAVKKFAGEVWDSAKDKVIEVVIASAPVLAKKALDFVSNWLKKK